MDVSTFDYLKPSEDQINKMQNLRIAAKNYNNALETLPDGPDKTWCIRNHRTTAMWANISITRLPDGETRID